MHLDFGEFRGPTSGGCTRCYNWRRLHLAEDSLSGAPGVLVPDIGVHLVVHLVRDAPAAALPQVESDADPNNRSQHQHHDGQNRHRACRQNNPHLRQCSISGKAQPIFPMVRLPCLSQTEALMPPTNKTTAHSPTTHRSRSPS